MAKIVLTDALGGFKWLEDFFSWNSTLTSSSATEALYTDETGAQTVLIGTGLQFSGTTLTAGTVTGVQLLDADGVLLVDITEGSYSAKDLKAGSFWEFVSALSAGDDTITGPDNGIDMNVMGTNHGDDTIIAGDGDSYMAGSEGKDSYTGGAGWDTLSYQDAYWQDDAKKGINLNAAKGVATDAWGDKDTFAGIEEYRGTDMKDTMKGSSGEDAFMGFEGADKIDGGGGDDTLRYHQDVDFGGKKGIVADLGRGFVIDGFGDKDEVSGIERVYGTYKADKFTGDDHDNMFRGLSGKDSYIGGGGTDEVSFDWWEDLGQHGVEVDLSLKKNQIIDDGFGNTETARSIESVAGGSFDDVLKLGKSNGWIWASDGDDTLVAGVGNQWFGGGNGADRFVFETLAAIGTDGNWDEIDDFSQADGDTIDLSGIGGLSFKGTAAFGKVAGEIRYQQDGSDTIIYGDTDGDGTADFEIHISATVSLTASDFVL
jgi:Ca2+-binding RTX toxin-like protein